MGEQLQTSTLRITKMTCVSCEKKIESQLSEVKGIESVKASYRQGCVKVIYDEEKIQLDYIVKIIEDLGYMINTEKTRAKISHVLVAGLMIIALFMLFNSLGVLNLLNIFPQAQVGMSYGVLFIVGFLTSFHCVAMCGGINMSQCLAYTSQDKGDHHRMMPSFLYNLGRVISYTFLGALVGTLGQVISLSGPARGIVQLLAGAFMVIMGLNLLNVFPSLRQLSLHMPKSFSKLLNQEKANSKSPFYIGLLNGLMPCGPLQAMQFYALSTGSPLAGAFAMFFFSMGTVPLMFGLGAMSSFLSQKFTSKMMTISAVLVIFMGVIMFNSGISLSGFVMPNTQVQNNNTQVAQSEGNIQTVTTKLSSQKYEPITVKANIPVKWIMKASEADINGCNKKLIINEYDIQKELTPGHNIIEFTPTATGTYTYSCWMGMIRSTITVVEGDGLTSQQGENTSQKNVGPETPSSNLETKKEQANKQMKPKIMTDKVVIAKKDNDTQSVEVTMDEYKLSPGIIVVQKDVMLDIIVDAKAGQTQLLFPYFKMVYDLTQTDNIVYLYPTESFEYSTMDYSLYGYVKVVDSLDNVDIEAIKKEVGQLSLKKWDYNEAYDPNNEYDCH